MIDIVKAKTEFVKYVKKFDIDNDKTKLKIKHIERVSQISKKLAIDLNLTQEDVNLAELIGLLHDIGRFEQIKRYNTFNDKKSVNHGELGANILFNENGGIIRNFIENPEYDEIIKKSILNHNKDAINIPKNLTDKELLHTKIIRDSDKVDILDILTYEKKETAWEKADLSDDIISEEIYNEFIKNRRIDYKDRKSAADTLVGHFAYIFDFNFQDSIKFIKEKNYMEKIYKRFEFNNEETANKYKEIYKIVCDYMA